MNKGFTRVLEKCFSQNTVNHQPYFFDQVTNIFTQNIEEFLSFIENRYELKNYRRN